MEPVAIAAWSGGVIGQIAFIVLRFRPVCNFFSRLINCLRHPRPPPPRAITAASFLHHANEAQRFPLRHRTKLSYSHHQPKQSGADIISKSRYQGRTKLATCKFHYEQRWIAPCVCRRVDGHLVPVDGLVEIFQSVRFRDY